MPAKQRLRTNEERRPARTTQQPAGRRQKHPGHSDLAAAERLAGRTASSCRSTTISRFLNSFERKRKRRTQRAHAERADTATTPPSSSLLHPNPKKSTLRSETSSRTTRAQDGFTYPRGLTRTNADAEGERERAGKPLSYADSGSLSGGGEIRTRGTKPPRSGFRDRHEHTDLQALCSPFASHSARRTAPGKPLLLMGRRGSSAEHFACQSLGGLVARLRPAAPHGRICGEPSAIHFAQDDDRPRGAMVRATANARAAEAGQSEGRVDQQIQPPADRRPVDQRQRLVASRSGRRTV